MSYRQTFAAELGAQFSKHLAAPDRSICKRIAEREAPNSGDVELLISILSRALRQEEAARVATIESNQKWDTKVRELIDTKTVSELQRMAGSEEYRPDVRHGRRLTGPSVHNEGRRDYYEHVGRYARAALKKLEESA